MGPLWGGRTLRGPRPQGLGEFHGWVTSGGPKGPSEEPQFAAGLPTIFQPSKHITKNLDSAWSWAERFLQKGPSSGPRDPGGPRASEHSQRRLQGASKEALRGISWD